MDPRAQLAEAFDHAHQRIVAIRPDQLDNPTPCAEWDVSALLSHTIGVVQKIGDAVAGNPPAAGEFTLADDPATQFRAAADAALAAWAGVDLDGVIDIGAGPMPGRAGLSINLLDTATHAWDIARATGQPEPLPEQLAAAVFEACRATISDDVRSFAGFDPAIEVAEDADPTTRLVAFLGRRP
jgi:uncharacterized protein (TIGR03086 family)